MTEGAAEIPDQPAPPARIECNMTTTPAMTIREFFQSVRAGAYADGGYPKYWLAADGETLSHAACVANAGRIARTIRGDANRADRDPARFFSCESDWRVVAVDVNWEDREMVCANTGERIPSAYAED